MEFSESKKLLPKQVEKYTDSLQMSCQERGRIEEDNEGKSCERLSVEYNSGIDDDKSLKDEERLKDSGNRKTSHQAGGGENFREKDSKENFQMNSNFSPAHKIDKTISESYPSFYEPAKQEGSGVHVFNLCTSHQELTKGDHQDEIGETIHVKSNVREKKALDIDSMKEKAQEFVFDGGNGDSSWSGQVLSDSTSKFTSTSKPESDEHKLSTNLSVEGKNLKDTLRKTRSRVIQDGQEELRKQILIALSAIPSSEFSLPSDIFGFNPSTESVLNDLQVKEVTTITKDSSIPVSNSNPTEKCPTREINHSLQFKKEISVSKYKVTQTRQLRSYNKSSIHKERQGGKNVSNQRRRNMADPKETTRKVDMNGFQINDDKITAFDGKKLQHTKKRNLNKLRHIRSKGSKKGRRLTSLITKLGHYWEITNKHKRRLRKKTRQSYKEGQGSSSEGTLLENMNQVRNASEDMSSPTLIHSGKIECHPERRSDLDISEAESSEFEVESYNSCNAGYPEIEIDVAFPCDYDEDQTAPEPTKSSESRNPIKAPGNENVSGGQLEMCQPKRLPIFQQRLPNPSRKPVAIFYYKSDVTMQRRCSKHHHCCQLNAIASAKIKFDKWTQWEDPDTIKIKPKKQKANRLKIIKSKTDVNQSSKQELRKMLNKKQFTPEQNMEIDPDTAPSSSVMQATETNNSSLTHFVGSNFILLNTKFFSKITPTVSGTVTATSKISTLNSILPVSRSNVATKLVSGQMTAMSHSSQTPTAQGLFTGNTIPVSSQSLSLTSGLPLFTPYPKRSTEVSSSSFIKPALQPSQVWPAAMAITSLAKISASQTTPEKAVSTILLPSHGAVSEMTQALVSPSTMSTSSAALTTMPQLSK